jgi:hypothetical protein
MLACWLSFVVVVGVVGSREGLLAAGNPCEAAAEHPGLAYRKTALVFTAAERIGAAMDMMAFLRHRRSLAGELLGSTGVKQAGIP